MNDSAPSSNALSQTRERAGSAPAGFLWQRTIERGHVWPIVLMMYAILIPLEARLTLGGQNLYPVRLVTLLLIPWALRRVFLGELRMHLVDWVMVALGLWMVVSFVAFYGAESGFLRGGALAMDTLAPYFLARLCIRSPDDFRRLLIFAGPGFALAGLSLAIESLTGTVLIRPAFISIFGPIADYANGVAIGDAELLQLYRMGLMRAAGPFSHPILAGILLASLLALYAGSAIRGWPRMLGLAAGCCALFTVSSAAALVAILALGLLGYEKFQKRVVFLSWPPFVGALILLALILEIASQNGLIPVLIRYTLDPATASYRLLIWEYGTLSVANNPLFGTGYNTFDRPIWMGDSVDNQWLVLGLRHGVAAPLLALLAAILTIWHGARLATYSGEPDRSLVVAAVCTFVALAVAGLSVAFFGSFTAWYYAMQGIIVSISAPVAINAAIRAHTETGAGERWSRNSSQARTRNLKESARIDQGYGRIVAGVRPKFL